MQLVARFVCRVATFSMCTLLVSCSSLGQKCFSLKLSGRSSPTLLYFSDFAVGRSSWKSCSG